MKSHLVCFISIAFEDVVSFMENDLSGDVGFLCSGNTIEEICQTITVAYDCYEDDLECTEACCVDWRDFERRQEMCGFWID